MANVVVVWLLFPGGNLTARIQQNHLEGRNLGEGELKRLLRHVSQVSRGEQG